MKSNPCEKLIEVFDLGIQPLANDFCQPGEPHAGFAPLKVMLCPKCDLAQLSVVVDPQILYRNYPYVTSPSQMMGEHFERLIADINLEPHGKHVLEIGSNDGKFLSLLKNRGFAVSGVDPAENLAAIATEAGITTWVGLFCPELARRLSKYDVVIARHVFCHIDDWMGFVRGLEIISHRDTLICIEVPHVQSLLDNCEFDTIYHEHLSYLSIKAVHALLRDTAFHLHKIIEYSIHGGAILMMLRHNESDIQPDPSLANFKENVGQDRWSEFSVAAKDQINRLINTVSVAKIQKKRVAALGASAKSTVWINACRFTRREIDFIADNTPQKQLTFSPGTDIPIVDEGAILRELPDYVVMFAWNYMHEILSKFTLARSRGVKFIVPLKTIEVV